MSKTDNHSQITEEILEKLKHLEPAQRIVILLACINTCFVSFVEKHYKETTEFKDGQEFEEYFRAVIAHIIKKDRMAEQFKNRFIN